MIETLDLPSGFTLIERAFVDSTNDEARHLAEGGASEGTVVWALEQRAGRGRRGRSWVSPPGNLYCSFVLRPYVEPARAAQLSLVAAVALGEAFDRFLDPAAVGHKWPNDVLINGRKVAGILLESSGLSGACVEWVVLGCGVNVASYPEDTEFPATSLRAEGAKGATVERMLEAFLRCFAAWQMRWREEGLAPVRSAWLSRAVGLGAPITVRLPDAELHGRFSDLGADGALILDLDGGGRRAVSAGEVFATAGT